jgi:hypothetical protein
MNLQQIHKEIEQATTRCVSAGTAVPDALDELDLGFVYGALQTLTPDVPVRSSRRPLARSGDLGNTTEGLFAALERLQAGKQTDAAIASPEVGSAVASPQKVAPAGTSGVPKPDKVPEDDPFAALRKRLSKKSLTAQAFLAPPQRTPLDEFRDTLAKAEHPLVKAIYEAN